MNVLLADRLTYIKQLLTKAHNAALATVNEDGSPHNSPVFWVYDANFAHVYWASHPATQHSRNVKCTGKAFMVVYDAFVGGGLYIRLEDVRELAGEELAAALAIFNTKRLRLKKGEAIKSDFYGGVSEQKMYSASITKLWVNLVERDAQGVHQRDYRQEIHAQDLL
jgi:uncharacterized protein YhbP (UPF0306 family)